MNQILLIDDHQMIINGIKLLLNRRFSIILEANSGATALELLQSKKPDFVIIDYNLPDMDGATLAGKIRYLLPQSRILGYSFSYNKTAIMNMLFAGVNGYLIKSQNDDEFLLAIKLLCEGKEYFCTEARDHIVSRFTNPDDNTHRNYGGIDFSSKELEIIRWVCKGLKAKEISKEVFLSERTVEQYRNNISRRIDANNIAGIIKFALRYGIVELDQL